MADKPQDNKPTGPISVRSYVLGRDGKLRGGEAAHDPEDEWKKAEAGWEVAKTARGSYPANQCGYGEHASKHRSRARVPYRARRAIFGEYHCV